MILNPSLKVNRDLLTKMSSIRNTDGVVTSHERYLYRGYLQIASLDMMEGQNQALINAYVWDPTQPVATRPLAIFYKGSAYYYGWDLTKNITEIFSLSARLQIDYVYTPFGEVRENGIIPQSARRLAGRLDKSAAFAPKGRTADGAAVSQPIQWSSEYHDAETGLVYYNFRYYNPRDGRWTRRNPLGIQSCVNPYNVVENKLTQISDYLGLVPTSSLQTPDGTRVLLEIAIATGSGIIGGVTSKMLENKCDKPNTFSEPVPFEVECTRKCKPKKKSGKTCKDKKGKGERKGRMICRAGLFRNTWKFVKWTEEGHDCNAAKCDSCCKSVKITYASKP